MMDNKSKWEISEPKTFMEFMMKHPLVRITVVYDVFDHCRSFRFETFDNAPPLYFVWRVANDEFYIRGNDPELERFICCEAEYQLGKLINGGNKNEN